MVTSTDDDALRALHAKYPHLPSAYFGLLSHLNGWEGLVEDRYTALFDATTALVATDDYQLPEYRPGYFVLGTNGGGELIVCADRGIDDRPIYHLPAIGLQDAEPRTIWKAASRFADAVLASARSSDA